LANSAWQDKDDEQRLTRQLLSPSTKQTQFSAGFVIPIAGRQAFFVTFFIFALRLFRESLYRLMRLALLLDPDRAMEARIIGLLHAL